MQKLNLAVFISGAGSNLRAIIEACKDANYPAQISIVIANKNEAKGIEFAKENNIPYKIIPHKNFANRAEFEQEILDEINKYEIDLLCLAGFMRVLSNHFLENFKQDIINIHPSLLPKYKGVDAIGQALRDGAEETGCTIHYVVPEVDSGEIILKRRVTIEKDDDSDSLLKKINKEEHIAYVEAIMKIAKTKKITDNAFHE